jgi:hypothetical protein
MCSIGLWNVLTLNGPGRPELLIDELLRFGIDLAVLTEARLVGNGDMIVNASDGTPSYKLFYSGGETHHRGVGFAIKLSLSASVLSFSAISDRLAVLELDGTVPFTVIAAYAPIDCSTIDDKDQFYHDLQTCCDRIPQKHGRLVLGDFNAETGRDNSAFPGILGNHGIGKLNDNGTRMLSFATANSLVCANSFFQHKRTLQRTFYSNDKRTVKQLDHVLVQRSLRSTVQDVRVYTRASIQSDHKLVVARTRLHLKVRRSQRRTARRDVLCLREQEKRAEFNVAVKNRFDLLMTEETGTFQQPRWEAIKSAIKSAMEEVCPVLERNTRPWISAATLELVEQRRNTHVRSARTRFGHQIKQALKRDEKNWLAERAEEMQLASDRGDSRTVYQVIGTLSGKKRASLPNVIHDSTGAPITSPELQDRRWAEYFSNLYNRPAPQALDQLLQDDFPAPSPLVDQAAPSMEEIHMAVKLLKTRKAPGTCDIQAEVIKALDDVNLIVLKDLITDIWLKRRVPQDFKDGIIIPVYKKGAKYDCSNYRGITLLSIAGKVLTLILRHRLKPLYEITIREEQSGFRSGRGCTDQIFTLRRCLERRLRHMQPTVACFVDFAAAFDSVHRQSMWNALRKCGVPELFVELIRDMYSSANSLVRTRSTSTQRPFPITTGVRQGCVLSPLLFNIVLNWVMNRSVRQTDGVVCSTSDTISELSYADDIVILQPDESSCQDLLDRISSNAGKLGLRIKPAKTKAIYFHLPSVPQLTVYGQHIEVTDSFTYLGSVLSSTRISAADEINVRLGKASAAFSRLKRHVFDRRDITIDLKMKIFNSSVLSVLLYASETWTITVTEIRRLETFQMYALRTILGVSRRQHLTNVLIREQCCNQASIESSIRKRRLRWLGHIARMPEERHCGSVWRNPKPSTWRCGRNAPKCTWDSIISKDLNFLKLVYGSANWDRNRIGIIKDLASDRSQWRRLVRGQATADV